MAGAGEIYAPVYAAMKRWGRYKLVPRAADAELFIDLAVTQDHGPQCGNYMAPVYLQLRMMVPNTNIVVWGFTQRFFVSGWYRKNTWLGTFSASRKTEEKAATALVDQIRGLAARADAEAAAAKLPLPQTLSQQP
jgi:hypothetical protein